MAALRRGSRSGFDQGSTRASRVVASRASRVVTFWASRVVTSSFLSLALRTFSAFLAPVPIDERKDPLGPHASRNGKRSSDKGFLAMAEAEYLERECSLGSDPVFCLQPVRRMLKYLYG